MKKIAALMLSGVVFLSGCSNRLMDFTILSSKNVDLSRAGTFKRDNKRVTGKDKAQIIIFIPTGTPNAKEAMDKAIESVPGAVALVDGVLTYKWFYIPYIYGESIYVIEGTALIDPSLRSASISEEGMFVVTHMDKQGNVKKSEVVSQEKFNEIRHKIASSTAPKG